jgi:hypothetical protein
MVILRLPAMLFLLCTAFLTAQTRRVPIVELYTDNSGFYFPAGRTLYAAVFDGGQLEYVDTTNQSLEVKRRVLTSTELIELRKLIKSKALLQFEGIVNAANQPQHSDYQTNLEVTIQRKRSVQRFTMRGFDAEDQRPFPLGLNVLLCLVDDLKHVEYRLSSNCAKSP